MSAQPSLATEIAAVSRLTGPFRLRSGAMADEYFDKYRFEAQPALLRRLALRMLELVPSGVEVLAGLELGGVPIATAMSLESGLPCAFVRKQAKTYGTRKAAEGADVAGRTVAVIEDVITTGGAVVEAVRHLEAEGARLACVVCAIWRAEGAPALVALPGLRIHAALTRADLS